MIMLSTTWGSRECKKIMDFHLYPLFQFNSIYIYRMYYTFADRNSLHGPERSKNKPCNSKCNQY